MVVKNTSKKSETKNIKHRLNSSDYLKLKRKARTAWRNDPEIWSDSLELPRETPENFFNSDFPSDQDDNSLLPDLLAQ